MKQTYKILLINVIILTNLIHNINAGPYFSKARDTKFKFQELPVDIQRLVADFAGINAPMQSTHDFYSPLQNAISNNDCDRVQVLIALGADVNGTPTPCQETPLFKTILQYQYASHLECYQKSNEAKSYAIFRYLLKKGADYNKQNPKKENQFNDKETPLHAAAENRNTLPLLQDLLHLPNINLDAQDRWGQTALDCVKKRAMSQSINAKYRKHYYKVCALLESYNAPSSVVLEPMPSETIMNHQRKVALREMERESMHWEGNNENY